MEQVETRSSQASGSSSDPTSSFTKVIYRLYISHFLSAWNSRTFEFGAILYLASAFPETLLYASLYACIRSLAAFLFSSWIGALVDRSNRLRAIRYSIVWQRLPVALSCIAFLALERFKDSQPTAGLLFVAVVALSCPEKLASIANTVAIERDWVVTITLDNDGQRQTLNAAMRRIDLCCKLLAPFFVSFLRMISTEVALWALLCLNCSSVLIEYFAIAQVYYTFPELSQKLDLRESVTFEEEESLYRTITEDSTSQEIGDFNGSMPQVQKFILPWRDYFTSSVFLPSLALSMLYFTVLSFGAQMITYLLATGFSEVQISSMRVLSVIFELAATWIAPMLMARMGAVRSGLWFINWQLTWVAASIVVFTILNTDPRFAALGLVVGVILSRMGLWGFDLCVQYIIQEGIPSNNRGRYSSMEAALQNLFELLSFATTMVFARPEQFRYPVLASAGAIMISSFCFTLFVKKNRGHLLHQSKCLTREKYDPLSQADST